MKKSFALRDQKYETTFQMFPACLFHVAYHILNSTANILQEHVRIMFYLSQFLGYSTFICLNNDKTCLNIAFTSLINAIIDILTQLFVNQF